MLRDSGLRNTELALDDGDDITGRLVSSGQYFEYSSPDRVSENVQCVHDASVRAYASPVYAARVRSAAARAETAFVPSAIDARHHASLLSRTNAFPSSLISQAIAVFGSSVRSPATCRSRPSSAESQPTPTAPGPN